MKDPRQRCLVGAILVALLGAVVLGGWAFRIEVVKNIVPGWTAMKPNTALGFILAGTAAGFLASGRGRRWAAPISGGLAIVLIGLTTLTLSQYFVGWDLGIDRWLLPRDALLAATSRAGRMSPASAFCFILTGMALFAQVLPIPLRVRLSVLPAVGVSVLAIGGFALAGYLLDALLEYRWWSYTGMALHTAAAFTALGACLLWLAKADDAPRWSLDLWTTGGFAIAVLLLLTAVATAYNLTGRLAKTAEALAHRQEVLKNIQTIASDWATLESSQRGYIITGLESLLAERTALKEETAATILVLRKLVSDNPVQGERLRNLEALIEQRYAWGQRLLDAYAEDGSTAAGALLATGKGIQLSKEARAVVREMEAEEQRLLESDRQEAQKAATMAFLLLPVGGFLSLTVLGLAVFFLNTGMAEQIRTARQLSRIADNVPCLIGQLDCDLRFRFANVMYERWLGLRTSDIIGRTLPEVVGEETFARAKEHLPQVLAGHRADYDNTIETIAGETLQMHVTLLPDFDRERSVRGLFIVAMDHTARKQAEDAIRQMNAELERRVTVRTAELEAANKELEAFSYSVSHDLRAPLRHIGGFADMLGKHVGDELDAKGQRYLNTISESARRMGVLIDDLLSFSRTARTEMQRKSVDLDLLSREVVRELEGESAGREITWNHGRLPTVEGDPALLRQVMINLLANALKYTRPRKPAVIETGCDESADERIIFVRDNGVGFDMAYADNLFGVFQRLHRSSEFEGTGIGLANVRRIIQRHGGRTWAEGEVGKGATIYFSLPKMHPDFTSTQSEGKL